MATPEYRLIEVALALYDEADVFTAASLPPALWSEFVRAALDVLEGKRTRRARVVAPEGRWAWERPVAARTDR